MAAMRQLVEGDCGGSNPLLQWTSHFSGGKPMARGAIAHDRLTELSSTGHVGRVKDEEEEMVREFLGEGPVPLVPQTFDMTSLLHQINSTNTGATGQRHKQDPMLNAWVSEFGHTHQNHTQQHRGPRDEEEWIKEFNTEQSQEHSQWVSEFAETEEEKWVREFKQEGGSGQAVASVAREMSSTVTDPSIQATEFMNFVKKLGNEELVVEGNEVKEGPTSWAEEFDTEGAGFWGRLEKEWEELARKEGAHPWLSEFNEKKEYKFSEDNPLKDIENPLEKGLEKMRQGDLPTAALLFEIAVQQSPEDPTAWQHLGMTQADNEREAAAIAALEKCLELDPTNLQALMGLAVSYTNESLQSKACQTLRQWLQTHPKYSSLVNPIATGVPLKPFMHSFMSKEEHEEVVQLFLRAAQASPEELDPDVQVGLGVLFNLSNEYEKAVDCFRAALDRRPDDAMLWNKLGATLANGNKSDEAVHAYRQALERAPGFTRCRYNLGISCINLKAYREAAEHFITALDLQRRADESIGRVVTNSKAMSESIWSTLRLAILYMGKEHLSILNLVDARDLNGLMREFIGT